MVGRGLWGLAAGWEGGQWYFDGTNCFPFHGENTGAVGIWNQREVRMVDDCTGRTQAKNKSQTPLTSPGTSSLPSEVPTLIRSTFMVSQISTSGVLKKFSKASDRVILTFVAQPLWCWGYHGCLQESTSLNTAGHTYWEGSRNAQITSGKHFEKQHFRG